MNASQADAYVERVCTQQRARPHPKAVIETDKTLNVNGRRVSFYTFPDGSRARVDRDRHGPTDAQVF